MLPWTGKPIELVELLYALHEAGCFDTLFLKDLFAAASEQLGCDVNNFYSLFNTVKTRGVPTKFIDKLRLVLLQKIEKSDEKRLGK